MQNQAYSKAEIVAWLNDQQEQLAPSCIVKLEKQGTQFIECERWFIAPLSWPQTSHANDGG